MLAMALLAWTALSLGAPPVFAASALKTAQSQSASATLDCHDAAMAPSESQHPNAPAMPAGHGDCCHSGCHCLSACNAVLLVPCVALDTTPTHKSLAVPVPGAIATAIITPPLRPPIT